MTTREPGAREVFTQGRRVKPSRRALRASSPAPIMTSGLEVLVQLVMAAITTAPFFRSKEVSSIATFSAPSESPCPAKVVARSASHWVFMAPRAIRSWGRRGPAREDSIEPMSSSTRSE